MPAPVLICIHVSVIVANQLLDMANKTVEYLMSRNKLLSVCVVLLYFTLKETKRSLLLLLKFHGKNHISYAFIHMWVSNEISNQTKKETYFYIKRCHKIGFVPHCRNFHIKLPLCHKLNEFYKQCDSLTIIFICEQFGMIQLLQMDILT